MKRLYVILLLCLPVLPVLADEGMWLPQLLKALNEKDMRKKGMKLRAEDIYSISKSSLKDAIVSLGGFCTAEVISGKGLMLTNHHCGFDAIQNHSSLEHNYLRDGFWAARHEDELTNPGLTATFIVRIEEVTSLVLNGLSSGLSEKDRNAAIENNIGNIKKNYSKEATQDILIRSFFEGNKYFLFVTKTFKDVRLVGAPPSSIGNFGKDTDNWMWPRHTGDFSLFRIYADKNNNPADYSPDNIPYAPQRSLNISIAGLKEGDFTMVFGFPGRTMEYLPTAAVRQIMTINDPTRIAIRQKALDILDGFMRKDEGVKIKYAAKYASIQNAYKKWQGEVQGLSSRNALAKKENYEKELMDIIEADPELQKKYGSVLAELNVRYTEYEPYSRARDYYTEIMPRIELFTIAAQANNLISGMKKGNTSYESLKKEMLGKCSDIFNEFDPAVDQRIFQELMPLYAAQGEPFSSPWLREQADPTGSYSALSDRLYKSTAFLSESSLRSLLDKDSASALMALENDPAIKAYKELLDTYTTQVSSKLTVLQPAIAALQRQYMAAQMEALPLKKFYPDANGTLRVTYGKVKGYRPRDGVRYGYYTYLDGVMEKYKPGDYEFDVPAKLIDLYEKKDFGRWGENGRQPVCLIAANHTTGGNSGSPALDARGNLVGLNFDRVWEGTMSDINYDADICRNVMVDIRYVLFIIDKFAGASNLINEMNIVNEKRR